MCSYSFSMHLYAGFQAFSPLWGNTNPRQGGYNILKIFYMEYFSLIYMVPHNVLCFSLENRPTILCRNIFNC